MNSDELQQSWQHNFGDCPPKADQLKWKFTELWFRIHALPASKRYPEDESEYSEIFRRHNLILTDLFGEEGSYFLLTGFGSLTTEPVRDPKIRKLGFQNDYWISYLSTDDDDSFYDHYYFDPLKWKANSVNELLRLVANDEVQNVMLFSSESNILYHPYDGGADIIFQKRESRNFYKEKYKDWLSHHSGGL